MIGVMVGVGGTAMPAFGDIFANPDGETFRAGDAWHLVSYILSLRTPAEQTAAVGAANASETK